MDISFNLGEGYQYGTHLPVVGDTDQIINRATYGMQWHGLGHIPWKKLMGIKVIRFCIPFRKSYGQLIIFLALYLGSTPKLKGISFLLIIYKGHIKFRSPFGCLGCLAMGTIVAFARLNSQLLPS